MLGQAWLGTLDSKLTAPILRSVLPPAQPASNFGNRASLQAAIVRAKQAPVLPVPPARSGPCVGGFRPTEWLSAFQSQPGWRVVRRALAEGRAMVEGRGDAGLPQVGDAVALSNEIAVRADRRVRHLARTGGATMAPCTICLIWRSG